MGFLSDIFGMTPPPRSPGYEKETEEFIARQQLAKASDIYAQQDCSMTNNLAGVAMEVRLHLEQLKFDHIKEIERMEEIKKRKEKIKNPQSIYLRRRVQK